MTSKMVQNYAIERGAIFDPSYGKEAHKRSMPVVIAETHVAKLLLTSQKLVLHVQNNKSVNQNWDEF